MFCMTNGGMPTLHITETEMSSLAPYLKLEQRVAGTIRFQKEVPPWVLIEIANKFKDKDPDQWVDLHIRSAGRDGSNLIAFHVLLKDGEEKTRNRFGHRLIQILRDRLGTVDFRPEGHPRGVDWWSFALVDVNV